MLRAAGAQRPQELLLVIVHNGHVLSEKLMIFKIALFVRLFQGSCQRHSANCSLWHQVLLSWVCSPCVQIVVPGTLVLALNPTPTLSKPLVVVCLLFGGISSLLRSLVQDIHSKPLAQHIKNMRVFFVGEETLDRNHTPLRLVVVFLFSVFLNFNDHSS